jgi:hypothetical protein
MSDRKNLLSQAVAIVNSFLSAVIIFYLLNHWTILFVYQWLKINAQSVVFVQVLLFLIRTFISAGLWGCLVQMASGEIILFDLSHFRNNALKFWWASFIILSLPFLVHFCLWAFFAQHNISLSDILNFFSFPLLFFATFLLVSWIYLRPLRILKKKIVLDRKNTLTLFSLFLVNLLAYGLLRLDIISSFIFTQGLKFFLEYLNVLSFVYLSLLLLTSYPEVTRKFQNEKELFLIYPPFGGVLTALSLISHRFHPPLFVILKALTPKNYKIRIFNSILWRNHYYQSGKIVAITCYSANSPEAYHLAKEFRNRGSKVILGGPHVSVFPDEALEFCDSVVVGEVENVWADIIRDYENDELKPKYWGEFVPSWPPAVYQELLQSPPSVIKDYLEASRGCHYHCDFCSTPYLTGQNVRKKSITEIVTLLQRIRPKYKMVWFLDDNIYSDPAYTRELFAAIKPLKIRWRAKSSIDIAKNDEVLRLAWESGCKGLLIGYEIFDGSPEAKQGGKMAMADQYLMYSKKLKRLGIKIKAHFVFGFDSDKLSSLLKLWAFCFRLRAQWIAMTLLTPMPGSPLFDQMLQNGRLTTLNWRLYSTMGRTFLPRRINYHLLALGYPVAYLLILFTASEMGNLILLITLISSLALF